MNFKKINVWVVLLLVAVLMLGQGCSKTVGQLVKLPTGEIVSAATDRFGSWERVEIARAGERTSKNNLELAKLEKGPALPQVQITINSLEEMEAYERVKSIEALDRSNQALKEVAVAYAPQNGDSGVVSTPFPEGAFSEALHAVGDAGEKVLKTPTSIAYGVGKGIGGVLSEIDQGAKIDSGGGDVTYKREDVRVGNSNTGTDISSGGDCSTDDCGEEVDTPEQYIDENGQCRVSPDCSCDSYNAGECS